jgi:hypothetical protein
MWDDVINNPWRAGALLIGAYWAWRNILGGNSQPQPAPPPPVPPEPPEPPPTPVGSISRLQAMDAADTLASYLAQQKIDQAKPKLAEVVSSIWGQ